MLVLLVPSFALAQSTEQLDVNNGYLGFKFFKSPSELKKIAALKRTYSSSKTKEEEYVVKSPAEFTVYGFAIESIQLSFYQEMLYQIAIKFQDQSDFNKSAAIRTNVYHQVMQAYGPPTRVDTSANAKMLRKRTYRYWSGHDVTLEQALPWENAAIRYTRDIYMQPIAVADTWYFISHALSNKRRDELNADRDFNLKSLPIFG